MQLSASAFQDVVDSYEYSHRSLQGSSAEVEAEDEPLHATIWGTTADDRSSLVSATAPTWLSQRCPTVRRIWVASADPGTETEITYGCPSCQTALRLTRSSSRLNCCPICEARVFTPDSLWTLLHGTVRMRTWIVELDGENRFDRKRRLEREHEDRIRIARERAARDKAEQAAAREASRQAALSRDLTKLGAIAKWVTGVHAVVVVAAIVAPWVARSMEVGLLGTAFGGYFATLLAGALGLGAGASIMTRVTGDRDLVFPVWFNFVFVTVMPLVGHMLGFEAIHGLRRGRYAKRYGRHANYAALNWAIISIGGLAFGASLLLACLL